MPGPTRKPSPGPWRGNLGRPSQTQQAKTANPPVAITIRPPLIAQWRPKAWPGDTWVYQNVAFFPPFTGGRINLLPVGTRKNPLGDLQGYNSALLIPPQPQFNLDYPATRQQWPSDFIFPNVASLSVTPPQPPAVTDAGRHHKRYKVILGSRTIYFATRAEAVEARERHRDGLILEAKAAGVDPRKIKVRRPRITQVSTDGRHPPDLAPAEQMARAANANHDEILRALNEARMREEEEIAIALLLQ